MADNQLVYDVPPGQFDRLVIDASNRRTVVVDLWAEWCAPCRMLGPVLEKVVKSFDGRAVLARVDIEQDREVAVRFGVQSIPSVKVFRNGEVVGEFVGALPEPQVRRILESLVPSAVDEIVAEGDRLIQERQAVEEAERKYRQALEQEPGHSGALLRLGTMAVERGQFEQARDLLGRIEQNAEEYAAAQGMLGRMEFMKRCAERGGIEACRQRAASDENDLEARYDLACCLAAEGQYEAALELFLEILKADRDFQDQAPKRAMLDIFALIGPRSELAEAYRRKLASVLY